MNADQSHECLMTAIERHHEKILMDMQNGNARAEKSRAVIGRAVWLGVNADASANQILEIR